VDSLQPGGRQAPKEAVQCLGVDVAEEAGEVWDGGIMTKLALGKVVKELLSDPVEDPEGHVVGATTQVPVVDPETQLKMRPQVRDALMVRDQKGAISLSIRSTKMLWAWSQ
jgi:hypothetical protein